MIKAISTWALPAEWGAWDQLPDTFRRLKALGFDGLELSFDPNGAIGFNTSPAEMAALRRTADEVGLRLTSMASGSGWSANFGQDDPEKRAEARRVVVKMLELAQAAGISILLVVPAAVDIFFIPQEPVVAYDVVMERVVEAMHGLIPECERTGVRIGMENVWNKFFLSPLEMRDTIDGIGSPFIGAYFDVGNVITTGYPDQWIRILGPRIFCVHVKDYSCAGAGFVDLLEGDVNWPAVMAAFQAIGYDGPLVSEILPPYRYYPLARVENTSNAMDWIMGRKH